MQSRTTIHWLAGFAGALLLAVPVLGWAASPTSHGGWGVGGIPAALEECQLDLEQCQASSVIFPGDGQTGEPLAYEEGDPPDGTFIDLNTGLMWETKLAVDDPDCLAELQVYRNIHCVQNLYTWSGTEVDPDGTAFTEFLAMLNGQAFAGFDDWRLPTVKELQSLVDYSEYWPAVRKQLPGALPGQTAEYYYWSSTSHARYDDIAWVVLFDYGAVYFLDKNDYAPVRAVRGGQ